MSGKKIIDGLNDALAFLNGDSERGRLFHYPISLAAARRIARNTVRRHGITVDPRIAALKPKPEQDKTR